MVRRDEATSVSAGDARLGHGGVCSVGADEIAGDRRYFRGAGAALASARGLKGEADVFPVLA